jgi:hypothetical protein
MECIEGDNSSGPILERVVATNDMLVSVNDQLQRSCAKAILLGTSTTTNMYMVWIRDCDFDVALGRCRLEAESDTRNKSV